MKAQAQVAPVNQIKKRASTPPRGKGLSLPTLALSGSGRNLYKMQEKEETHEEIMQRFHLRKVSSGKSFPSTFGRGKNVVIDKATGSKRRRSQRFSLRRSLRSISRSKARKSLLLRLLSPITPRSWTSTLHGIVMLAVYHFQLLYLPFLPSYFPRGSRCSTFVLIALEAIFLLDILLNLNTAFFEQGVPVTSRKRIASRYVRKRWFLVDLLSAIPLQVISCVAINSIDTTHAPIQALQVTLMTVRLCRATFLKKGVLLSRVMRVANHLTEWVRYSRYSHLLGIAQLMWLVLLIAHYMACLWHVVSRDHASLARQEDPIAQQYVADYYYAVSLIQGQGDDGTWSENLFSSVVIIMGSVILAIVFGNVGMLVSNFNANTTNYHRKMEAVYATMAKMELPQTLRDRVSEYYTHVWLEYEALDGNISKFQQELTHTLRIEIGLYKFMALIATISFWDNCTPDFLTQIVLNLGVRVYMPDDYVVRRREIGHEMMMINLGYCKLSKPLKRLNEAKEDPAETAAASDELTDEDNKPVLLPQDFDSDASGDESYDESSDDDNEDATSRVRSSPRNIRRASGLVFELQGSDLDSDHPRRRSIPSSVPSSTELEQPKTFQTYLKPGQVFGEMSLLMNYKRQANIRAVTFVEMCVLDRATFQKIISRYPEDRRRVLTKMLQSCIEKKEIPFPWENIIEAVSAKRRSSGLRDITRASVIATMTAAEAARILVESIDVNVPDESIKYGFQSFEQEFVEEPALRRANSVGAKIRETLQRTNSGIRDTLQRSNSGLTRETLLRSHSGLTPLRAYSRRNSSADSCRSSSTGDLTELESEMSGVSSHSIRTTEKTLETMMQLMHTMVESIGRLQRDVNELKSRTCCCSREPGASKGNRHHAPKRSKSATVVANRDLDRGQAPAKHSPDREHADSEEPRTIVNESAKQEPQASRKSSLLAMLPSSIRSISRQNSGNSTSPNARTGLMNSGRASQRSPKSKNSGSKVSPRSDVSAVDKSESSLLPLELDPYANPRHSSRSRPGRQPTLADILWKRSNSSTDHARTPSRNSQTLKSRHSMPAGVSGAPGGSDEDKQPPLADDQEPPVGHEETENLPHQRGQSESARDYPVDSSRASNRDPRCLTIDE